jgi:ABC-2 type transport system ATP-binding protein
VTPIFQLEHVTKRFKKLVALDDVSLTVDRPSIIGLVGKNASGKTTLLRHVIGLYLPTSGHCTTFGTPTPDLGARELSRIGAVHQHERFLGWMTIYQLLKYVSSFYARWDTELEAHLVAKLELDRRAKVGTLSPGTVQKLALVMATCHHPELLLLDEPLSDLDAIARQDILTTLLDCFQQGEVTIVISSHLLHDVERIADHIVMIDRGRLVADAPLDELTERYAEWIVTSREGALPEHFAEHYVIAAAGDRFRASLIVREPAEHFEAFRAIHGVEAEHRPLNLERIFRVVVGAADAEQRADEDQGGAKNNNEAAELPPHGASR